MSMALRSEAMTVVLRVLGPEPQTVAEIARRVSFSGEAVRWALHRLLSLGKVERTRIAGVETRGAYGWRLDSMPLAKGE